MTPEQVALASDLLERRRSLQEQVRTMEAMVQRRPITMRTAGGTDSLQRMQVVFGEGWKDVNDKALTVTLVPLDVLALLREYERRVEESLKALGVSLENSEAMG